MPALEPVEFDVKELHIIERLEVRGLGLGGQCGDLGAEDLQAARPQSFVTALGNQIGHLEVTLARNHDQHLARRGARDE